MNGTLKCVLQRLRVEEGEEEYKLHLPKEEGLSEATVKIGRFP